MRATLLWLWLEATLCSCSPSWPGPTQRLSPPEVVTPLKVTGRSRGTKTPGWLSYSLLFGGQRHVVHMRVKKLLVSTHLPILTYTDQHALVEDQPFLPEDCYYHGYVEGAPQSLAVFSACFGGLRGVLQVNGLMYEIEPIRHSTVFEHLVYRLNGNETQSPNAKCGLTEEKIVRQHLELAVGENLVPKHDSVGAQWTHIWILELVIVTDHDFFIHSQGNLSKVQEDVFFVVNVVDSMYRQLHTYVNLIGIEIWNKGNVFQMTTIDQVLDDFSQWKKISLAQLQHDAAHIFIQSAHIDLLGLAYVAGICQSPIDCGVCNFRGDPWSVFANTVAHELGHILGMVHDEKPCSCGEDGCIMSAYRVPEAKRFTNCSYLDFMETVVNQGSCLHNIPSTAKVFLLKRCGNGVVEKGEQCDCGDMQQCEHDPCCLPNCTLRPGAACAFGLCCKDCQFVQPGQLCRQQVNECDLPEWCNGTSPQCPQDAYVQDGVPCSSNAYCYRKECNHHDQQCRAIFGPRARSASQTCYREVNSRGNRFGHCGMNGTVYLKCDTPDVFCGRVQCESVEDMPPLPDHSVLQSTHVSGVTCWSIGHHQGVSMADAGEVKDGTTCEAGKICIHKKCVNLSVLSQDCLSETCNMKGTCNNKHHCHCAYGWSPPNCLHRGYGGSMDSGPASPIKTVFLKEVLIFLLSAPICFLTVGLYMYHRIRSGPKATERFTHQLKKNFLSQNSMHDISGVPGQQKC
ncbi:disintegrin and metalloproteinase domain-containing protein 21 [Octodon degus]|uniref:Disintegrin and metalloproteinase domain-containing protein 21 n=1 Tax=Octodon degus TaxID=10160 RepID=A0A6P3EIK9_OCTDE|nr:disintegrin and metalloproteinase domain-containing protein 21 [Octodon degus]